MNKQVLTAIVPCFNEEESIEIFYEELNRVSQTMQEVDFEIIFVDDGSSDQSAEIMQKLSDRDPRVCYLSFSRNFGKEAAMYAGLQNAQGDYVAIMDVDLQDPPSLLPEMYAAITEEGYDSVATRRVTRSGEPKIRSFFARMFYRIINKISSADIVDGARDYRLMSRKFVDALLQLTEYNRFSKGLFGWIGFRTKWLEFENTERVAGETKWSFWKLFKYSLEGIVAFSTTPLAISSVAGIFMCFFSFIAIVFIIVRQLLFGGSAYGWPSMICVIIFIGGIQLLGIGILGLYLSKAYLEIKKRPVYILQESRMNRKADGE